VTTRKGRQGVHPSRVNFATMQEREIGRWLPAAAQAQREATMERIYNERRALCRAAINEACFVKRDVLARKMYRGEAFTADDWPALSPLTPGERTAVIKEIRQVFGTPERKQVLQ
jgi:hypothetical protein